MKSLKLLVDVDAVAASAGSPGKVISAAKYTLMEYEVKQQDIGATVRRSLKNEKSISGSLVSSDYDKESRNDENGEEDDKPNANAGETKSKKVSSINHRGV